MAFADDANPSLAQQAAPSCGELAGAAYSVAGTGVTRRAPADVRLPCMVYAAVGALCDAGGGAFEMAMSETRRAPGVLQVLPYAGANYDGSLACQGGVAVVARGYWLARQALNRLVEQCGNVSAGQAGSATHEGKSAASGLTGQSAACTVQFYNGRVRVWMSTSHADRARQAAARLAGVAVDAVDLRVLGTEDAPQGLAVLVPGVALARALESAPVQIIIGYDLGLLCDLAAHGEAPPQLREVGAAPAEVALAA